MDTVDWPDAGMRVKKPGVEILQNILTKAVLCPLREMLTQSFSE